VNPFPTGTDEHTAWDRANADEGAALLDRVHQALTDYLVLPSPAATDAVTLWVAATHAQPAWEHASRLVVKSPLRRCGKTRLLEVVSYLVHRPLRTTNISVAALARSVDADDPPTVILDEADTVFATHRGERSEKAEDLRGILNSGHSRGWPYIRWNATRNQREDCPTFAMALLAAIGDLPDTIEDRAITVAMRRRAPNEHVTAYRSRRVRPQLADLRTELRQWVTGQVDELTKAEPTLPVEDRAADVWEPLVAVADLAGGAWPDRARTACTTLTGAGDPDAATASERLLGDLHTVFAGAECLWTTTVLERLRRLDEAPWATWTGRDTGMNSRELAKLLRPFGVLSRNVREGGTGDPRKGYTRADLHDPWQRYTPPPAHQGHVGNTRDDHAFAQVNHVADPEWRNATLPLHASAQVSDLPADLDTHVAAVTLVRCARCGEPLDPALTAAGMDTHPGCDPGPPHTTDPPGGTDE
jgi:hypothetical protein